MNSLCYDRASSVEYEAWSKLGNSGWTWSTMFNAMTKSENFTGTDKNVRGRSGPIRNLYNRIRFDIMKNWQPAARALGLPINEEGYMGGNPIGVMFQGTNIDSTNYTRSYSANSYLPLAQKNLVVRTNAIVAKIELQRDHDRISATGVKLADGTTIQASKEVILSAGTIQSPGLLEVSGIGQSEVLKAAGITTLINLPGVGENFQDHIRVSNTYRLKEGIDSYDQYVRDPGNANATKELQKWFSNERSLYDYSSSTYGLLKWIHSSTQTQKEMSQLAENRFGSSSNIVDKKKLQYLDEPTVPDFELLFEPRYAGAYGYTGGNFFTIYSALMHPMSRGSVHINSSNPTGMPIVDPKFLSNEHDRHGLVEAAKFARRIASTEPIRSLWLAETEPGADVQTDAQWKDFVGKTMETFFHSVGTCSMLPKNDGGVVDENLIVHGTSNLRVVDVSIIPVVLSAHLQTAAYGIAEVAAEKIIAAANRG